MAKSKQISNRIGIDEAKWQAEADLNTCISYYEIKKDPKRMAAVRKLAKEKVAALKQHIGENEK